MKKHIKNLLEQKVQEDKDLEKEFKGNWLRYTIENYIQRKDKLETEIELLKRILKESSK